MQNELNVCFSGLTSCGKTSHANFIAKKYGVPRVSASQLLIEQGKENGLHDVDFDTANHPWLGDFDTFNVKRRADANIDRAVDNRMLELMNTVRGVVVESLTLPYLAHRNQLALPSLLIYLHASHKNRLGRAYNSSRTKTFEALDVGVRAKDKTSQEIIHQIWGTDILNMSEQFSYNDVILNTDEVDNGDPHDESNVEYGKRITRTALINILDMMLGHHVPPDALRRIADSHPTFFTKLPQKIWNTVQ